MSADTGARTLGRTGIAALPALASFSSGDTPRGSAASARIVMTAALLPALLLPTACRQPPPEDGAGAGPLRPAYQALGMTDAGSGYTGRVQLTGGTDGRYAVRAVRGADTLAGTLAVRDDSVVLHLTDPRAVTGAYVRYPDGRLEGRWRADDGSAGWEVLRPFATSLQAPWIHEEYRPAEGTIRIGPEPDALFPRTDVGYTLIRPADTAVGGVAVFFDGFRAGVGDTPVEGSFDHEALRAGVAILRVTTGDPLDFLFTDADVDAVLRRVSDALVRHGLDGAPLLFAGLSLGGTRAARAAIRVEREPAAYPALRLAALAVVDAPLDMARLYRGEIKAIRDDAHPAAAGEGRWVSYRLREALGGAPQEVPGAYVAYSPVSAARPDGGNARALAALPVRAYHEPDIDWWIEHRSKTYAQINSPDLALLIERLRAMGNHRAELITTHRRRDGWRFGSSPHTWSIVDNAALVAWFLRGEKMRG